MVHCVVCILVMTSCFAVCSC